MRKLLIALVIGAVAVSLAACGASSTSLTSVQAKAVRDVNTQLSDSYGVNASAATVVGTIAKDGQGNKVVLVHETYKEKDSNGKTQTYDLIIIVITKQNGTLIYADVLVPSEVVTVSP